MRKSKTKAQAKGESSNPPYGLGDETGSRQRRDNVVAIDVDIGWQISCASPHSEHKLKRSPPSPFPHSFPFSIPIPYSYGKRLPAPFAAAGCGWRRPVCEWQTLSQTGRQWHRRTDRSQKCWIFARTRWLCNPILTSSPPLPLPLPLGVSCFAQCC